jgi:hypothetical protein
VLDSLTIRPGRSAGTSLTGQIFPDLPEYCKTVNKKCNQKYGLRSKKFPGQKRIKSAAEKRSKRTVNKDSKDFPVP